ncbi:MAG: reverse transcriptase/maturase family protein [Candidatus Kaiserbacteria bacterium]|nr:reverse transcriptase/maturase family protein [Candidatus Kaiserbacteria bacterium]
MNPTFNSVCSFESLLRAYRRARRASPKSHDTLAFGWHLEKNLLQLRDELMNGQYRHGAYREFVVEDAKKRHIKAASFRDRVVHHAICSALEPIFERRFIGDSYACRAGKGTHAALRRLEVWLRRGDDPYVLSCDISKYFASINHENLMMLIASRVSDSQLVSLCRSVVESTEDAPGRGIPIGNLTSQLFANVYLDALDHHAKRVLGIRRYIRYMDDFLIFGKDTASLHETKARIVAFLGSRLGLVLHPKKANVFPVVVGVPFLGYRVFRSHRLLRKSTVMRFARRVRQYKLLLASGDMEPEAFFAGMRSWSAYADDAASSGLKRSLAGRLGISFAPFISFQTAL